MLFHRWWYYWASFVLCYQSYVVHNNFQKWMSCESCECAKCFLIAFAVCNHKVNSLVIYIVNSYWLLLRNVMTLLRSWPSHLFRTSGALFARYCLSCLSPGLFFCLQYFILFSELSSWACGISVACHQSRSFKLVTIITGWRIKWLPLPD